MVVGCGPPTTPHPLRPPPTRRGTAAAVRPHFRGARRFYARGSAGTMADGGAVGTRKRPPYALAWQGKGGGKERLGGGCVWTRAPPATPSSSAPPPRRRCGDGGRDARQGMGTLRGAVSVSRRGRERSSKTHSLQSGAGEAGHPRGSPRLVGEVVPPSPPPPTPSPPPLYPAPSTVHAATTAGQVCEYGPIPRVWRACTRAAGWVHVLAGSPGHGRAVWPPAERRAA